MNLDDETEARILDKATHVEEAVAVLAEKRMLDEDAYLSDREQRAIVEREFQTAIEACIDIASLLCKSIGADVPEQNAPKFTVLAEHDVVSAETAGGMQEAAGFRNVLAHQYGDDLDNSLVYRSLQSDLDWFPRYLRDVRRFLDEA